MHETFNQIHRGDVPEKLRIHFENEEVSEKKVDEKEEVVAKSKPKRSNSAMYDLAAMDGVMWADDNAEDKNDVNQSDVSLTDIITSLWK